MICEPRRDGCPVDLPHVADGFSLNAAVRALETRLIAQALDRAGGSKAKAARLLGINRTTLVMMLKRFTLPLPPDRVRPFRGRHHDA